MAVPSLGLGDLQSRLTQGGQCNLCPFPAKKMLIGFAWLSGLFGPKIVVMVILKYGSHIIIESCVRSPSHRGESFSKRKECKLDNVN